MPEGIVGRLCKIIRINDAFDGVNSGKFALQNGVVNNEKTTEARRSKEETEQGGEKRSEAQADAGHNQRKGPLSRMQQVSADRRLLSLLPRRIGRARVSRYFLVGHGQGS